jgi:hypothetical protein
MVLMLDRYTEDRQKAPEGLADRTLAGHAVMTALLKNKPATFVIEARDTHEINRFASPLRMFLLMSGRWSGGVSATVSPHFSEQTYPALLNLVGALNDSGAADLWKPDGSRSVMVGEARHVFVSVDMQVIEKSMHPDRLLEIVAADDIADEWYRARVAPRLSPESPVVRVFYGKGSKAGSTFAAAEDEAIAEEALTGERRRFSISGAVD